MEATEINQAYGLQKAFEKKEDAYKYLFSNGFTRPEIIYIPGTDPTYYKFSVFYRAEKKTEAHVYALRECAVNPHQKPFLVVYFSEEVEKKRLMHKAPRPVVIKNVYALERGRVNYAQ